MSRILRAHKYLILILLIGGILIFKNLGQQVLWQDEAQTALLSKTILETGLPYGTDGKNYFSQELGIEYGEGYIWKWHTWLPFYLQAFFMWVLGTSDFVTRLPFALCGLVSIYFGYQLSLKLNKNREQAIISSILIATSIGVILLSRQARIYSPLILFSTTSLIAFFQLLDKRTIKNQVFLIISTTALFHTHYLYFVSFFTSIGLYTLIFERARTIRILIPSLLALAINSPWIYWLSSMRYYDNYSPGLDLPQKLDLLRAYSKTSYRYILGKYFIWCVAGGILLLKVFKSSSKENGGSSQRNWALLIFVLINLLFIAAFSPGYQFRYLCVILVPAFILMSIPVHRIVSFNRWLAIPLLVVWLYVNKQHQYIYELTHDFNGPIEGIVKTLQKEATPQDTVLITYGDMPLKWYTDLKVYGGLTGEDIQGVDQPTWVINRQYIACEKDSVIKAYIESKIDLSQYEEIVIPYPDTEFENREDPRIHLFKTADDNPVRIYRRKY